MWGNSCCASTSGTLSPAFQIKFCCRHEGLKRLLAISVWLSVTQRLTSPSGAVLVPAQQGAPRLWMEMKEEIARLDNGHPPGHGQKGKAWPKGTDLSRVLSHRIWAGLFSHLILCPTHYVPLVRGCARNLWEIADGGGWGKAQSQGIFPNLS